jgi:rubrerythrin
VPLSGRDFEYFKGIKQMLEYGISQKEKSIINYKIIISKILEKEIKNILEIIICDEQKHKEMLENLLKKYNNC